MEPYDLRLDGSGNGRARSRATRKWVVGEGEIAEGILDEGLET